VCALPICVQTQKYLIPGKPSLAKVDFKNIDTLRVKIYKVKMAEVSPALYRNDLANYIKGRKAIKQQEYILPRKEGYFEWSTEIMIPALEKGTYIITFSEAAPDDTNNCAIVAIQATKTLLVQQILNRTYIYQTLDAETGEPVKGAIAYLPKKNLSDKDGNIIIPGLKKDESNKLQNITVIHEGDTLSNTFRQHYYDYPYDAEDINARVQLYLDRAIYRPGQTVYFKGIVVQEINGTYSTVNNIYVTVLVEAPSGDEIKKLRLKVNEFGSFSGEFILPAGGMTGEFRISVEEDEEYKVEGEEHEFWDNYDLNFEGGYARFRVEEYKRPTFEVIFDPVTDDIRVNEAVTVTGKAVSFSGAPVAGAKVKYSIHKSTLIGFRREGWEEPVEGETVTGPDGKFAITFTATPDPAAKKEELPVFSYVISVDVIDITGETRFGHQRVSAGYHSLALSIDAPEIINPKKENTVTLYSENLNRQFMPVDGEVTVYRLRPSSRILTPRWWPEPDIQTILEEEYIKNFPHARYSDKDDKAVREKQVYSIKVDTGKEKHISLKDFRGWESGKYEIVFAAKDSLGNIVEAKTLFSLTRDEDLLLPDNIIFDYETVNKDYKKDGYIELSLRSSLPVLYVNVNSYNRYKNILKKLVNLKNGRSTIRIPLGEEKIDEVSVHFDFVWQNYFFEQKYQIKIPVPEEKIAIETISIANKLLPGSSQTWSFALKDSNKAPVEVLASMYDASLDQFSTESWDVPKQPSNNYGDGHYRSMLTTGLAYGSYYAPLPYVRPVKLNDAFYTYGFGIIRSVYSSYKHKQQLYGSGSHKITGTITNDKDIPIHGVYIVVEGTGAGTETDETGQYTLFAEKGDKLLISGAPYLPKEIIAEKSGTINIQLERDPTILEDAVVEAYRNTTVRRSAAAVTTLSIETIEDRANYTILQNLQGQVAGLNIATGTGGPGGDSTIILRGVGSLNGNAEPLFIVDGLPVDEDGFRSIRQSEISTISVLKDAAATSIYGNRGANGVVIINTKKGENELKALQQVKARKNFDETAFFHPHLLADKDGKISINFTTPEALTEWKLRILAHNKKAVSGYLETVIRSQKDLMVVPNMPRFLREKDTITITAKITNMVAEAKDGNALLQLFDAATMQPVDVQMMNNTGMKPFKVAGKGSTTVSWTIAVPEGLAGIQYKIVARSGDYTDGEENILPVLSNTILVTESVPLWVKPNTTKQFTLKNLAAGTSSSLRHQGITLEYTSNPAWTALQALPYLMEFEHECAEQVFSRYYANAIASHVLKSNPKIAEVFANWRKNKTSSKLEQNEELKAIVIAETPWLLDSQTEEEKKNRIALLFDLEKMQGGLLVSLNKLYEKQKSSGGFAWFEGGNEDEFITRHILAGIGHLNKLGIKPFAEEGNDEELIENGLEYIDNRFEADFTKTGTKGNKIMRPYSALHYLYTRSFYLYDHPLDSSLNLTVKRHISYFRKDWLGLSLYDKAMAALVMHRFGEHETAKKIIEHLKEASANNDEWGMYWIENKEGWHWYRSPIETQALLIEAFTEINNDIAAADAMKVWLLKKKQTKNWPTTKSTTEAVYALLMQGSDWLSVKENTIFKLGEQKTLDTKMQESGIEAGTGYIKLNWQKEEINKEMATLTIENKSGVPGYGGFYWQYFEELDKIKPAQQGLMTVIKELFITKTSGEITAADKITAGTKLKIGDKVTVRLVISVKEDMEYVHLKDMRAAGFEPVDVLSGYEWEDGLGYYRSTKDAATHFFFDRINKGTYVLEYELRVNNAGEFSNGITTLQSMYAPEFSAHTKGDRVKIE
jgi:TonB-dependent SusC/RagA subfamily outer membrane receptor